MSNTVTLLRRAIRFYNEGESQKARYLLISILKEDKTNELAWKYLVDTYSSPRAKYLVYQKWQSVLPLSREAAQGLQKFSTIYFPAPNHSREAKSLLSNPLPVWTFAFLFLLALSGAFVLFTGEPSTAFAQAEPRPVVSSPSSATIIQAPPPTTSELELQTSLNIAENAIAILEESMAELERMFVDERSARQAVDAEKLLIEEQLVDSQQAVADLQFENANLIARTANLQNYIDQHNLVPSIFVRNETIYFQFFRANGQPLPFEIPYTALVETNELSMNSNRYHRYLSVSAGNMTGQVMDYRYFIQPVFFTDLMEGIELDNGDRYQIMNEAWTIVSQVDLTDRRMNETPQFPLETLVNGGDVEDKVILMASMLKAAPVQWNVSLAYVDSTSFNIKHSPNYVMIKVEFEGQTFFVDPAGDSMMPFNGVDSWDYLIR